jgi:predicted cupin superfamily sugar epimerase
MTDLERLRARWDLQRLPGEGGYFAQTWRSAIAQPGGRPAGTAILFLVTREEFSALHRLDADELWHFCAGDPVEHVQLFPNGAAQFSLLGPDVTGTHLPQAVARAGTWQGAKLAEPRPGQPGRGWALLGCTMAPGWTENGGELATRSELSSQFPQHRELIERFTRATG